MRREHYALDVKADDDNGDAFNCEDFVNMTVVLKPGKTGTVILSVLTLQVSNDDGDSFRNYGTAADAGTEVTITLKDEAWTDLRVVTSSYVSGTPVATFAGDNSRTS